MLRASLPARLEVCVSHRLLSGLLLLSLACGGGPGGAVPADSATTPEGAVRSFMQAVADSNINRMGRYWGTSRGPASQVRHPSDYEQRLFVTQSFLRDSPFRILRTDPVSDDRNRVTVQVDLDRTDSDGTRCTRSVPFTALNLGKHGWIVTSIDLTLAGTPGRSCGPRKSGN
jgi:hypothetical protein